MLASMCTCLLAVANEMTVINGVYIAPVYKLRSFSCIITDTIALYLGGFATARPQWLHLTRIMGGERERAPPLMMSMELSCVCACVRTYVRTYFRPQ